MNREQLFTFLLAYAWFAGIFACYFAVRWRAIRLAAVVALAAAAILPILGARIFPDSNALAAWAGRLSRGHFPVLAIAIAASVPWVLLMKFPRPGDTPESRRALLSIPWVMLLFLGCFTVTIASSSMLMLVAPPVEETADAVDLKPDVRALRADFEIQELATLNIPALCLTVSPSGSLYAAATIYSNGDGREYGSIIEILPRETGPVEVRPVASSVLLWRVYGMTMKDGDLYVSRSGRMARARKGEIRYENVGVVTRLSDLDGDGRFEYFDDVLSDLPGSQGISSQHQNNGLLFQPDGTLLICSGNTGDRSLPVHPWEGCVLEVSSDFKNVSVFASGLRNPFSITRGPDGELFLIDQDWELAGDELNHLVRDAHYGHPYLVGEATGEGFTKPLLLAKPESNLVSVAYSNLPVLKDCLLITDWYKDKIYAVHLQSRGDQIVVESREDFAHLPDPIDICAGTDGVIYVLTRDMKIFRIRPRQE